MKVKLRMMRGTLQDAQGRATGHEVRVRGPRFVIGSAADCAMRCRSDSVLPHHCEIMTDGQQTFVRPLSDVAPTFVNGRQVEREQTLQAGDQLRIGRFDFEVLIVVEPAGADRQPATQAAPTRPSASGLAATPNPAATDLYDLLTEADERERVDRQMHPELRVLHLASTPPEAESSESDQADAIEQPEQKPGKKKPGKLPTPPPKNEISGEDSTDAAQQALRKLFSR